MKNPLQVLLIFLSFCLCAFIAFQWHREANLRIEIQTLNDTIHEKMENIQNKEGMLKRSDEEIKRLDGLKTELTATVKSNRTDIARLMKDVEKSDQEVEKGLKQIEVYKDALSRANSSIQRQNEDVKKQNEDMKKLASDHTELVLKHNKLVAEFNDLAQKWNDAQAAAAAAATNAAAKK